MKDQNEISQKNPFRVPEGYFEEVNRKIIESATASKENLTTHRSTFRLRPYLLTAASVALLVMLSYSALRLIIPHTSNQHRSEITSEEYLAPYMNDLDIYYLEENAASVAIPEPIPQMSKAEIIDYLVLDNIEITEIYEQL
jgi:hypothetical protein